MDVQSTIQTKDFIFKMMKTTNTILRQFCVWCNNNWWNNKWTQKAPLIHPLKRWFIIFPKKARLQRKLESHLSSLNRHIVRSRLRHIWFFLPVCFRVITKRNRVCSLLPNVCMCVFFKSSLGLRKTQRRKRSTMNKKQNKKDISRIFLWDTIIEYHRHQNAMSNMGTFKVGLYTSDYKYGPMTPFFSWWTIPSI